jgi:hypothetical protein
MKNVLKRQNDLFHYSNGTRVVGPNPNMSGDCTGLTGDCSGL